MTDKSLPTGTRLQSQTDVYTIESVLGAGGFGITYKAWVPARIRNITSHAPIAIKEHFPAADCERDATTSSLTFSSAARDRVLTSLREFIDEARCLQRIAGLHPNIVNVNEVFEANNTAYYVMEYLEGVTLKQYVISRGRLPVRETVSLILPVIEAVATLHKNKFTHLDIKPSNIMLTETDGRSLRPVLIDFGLAKHYNPDGSATATVATTGFSDGYAPIEQYSGITRFSPAVDVYSLGATILFCLTGQTPPRAAEVTPEKLNAIIPRDIPEKMRNLLIVSMSFQAIDRLPNAQQLYLALKPMAEDEGVTVSPDVIDEPGETETIADIEPNDRTRLSDDPDSTVVNPGHIPPGPPDGHIDYDPEPYPDPEPEKPGTPAWIWCIIALLAIAIGVAGFLVYNNMQEPIPPDVPQIEDVPDVEQAESTELTTSLPAPAGSEETTATEKSETLSDGSATPDLSFHDLSGPVKSCKNQWGAILPYDRSGNWVGNYSDYLGPRTFTRDSRGRILSESYSKGANGPGTIYYSWDGNKLTSMTDDNRNQEVAYTYNSDGSMATQTIYSNGKYITYRFSGEKRDSHGNWISRSYRREATDSNGNTTTTSGTQRRTITYY